MSIKSRELILVALLSILSTAHATTWYVHPDSVLNTIQMGLDSCVDNDTVLVAAGTYHTNIFWPLVNGIKLFSESGPGSTIVDGDSASCVIYFSGLSTIDTTTVVKGFTIQNGGSVTAGGGVCIVRSSPKIESNIIRNNDASAGGGIYCCQCNPLITGNTITGNAGGYVYCAVWCDCADADIRGNMIISNNSGVGCYCCNPTIEGNRIISNGSPGVACSHSSPAIRYNYISGNTGSYGGIYCISNSHPSIIGDTIVSNAGTYGGGITCVFECSPLIDSNVISNNTGSGIYLEEACWATITNNIITGNSDEYGGGIFCILSADDIMYNIISGNSATIFGGGMYLGANSTPGIRFNTVTENTADSLGDGIFTIGSYPVIDSNNIYNNGYGVYNITPTQVLIAEYNWWGDPTGPYHQAFNPSGLGDSTNLLVDPVPFLTDSVTGIKEEATWRKSSVSMMQPNFPNPFSEVTTIQYYCPKPSQVIIKVYNSIGQEVATLVDERKKMGTYSVQWDASGMSNGIYFYQMTVDGVTETRKCLLVR